jgi:putative transcriptional regulator
MYGTIKIWKGGKILEIEIKLHELMARKNIRTVVDLSEKSDVNVLTLYNVINYKNKSMRLDTIAKLCKTLECEINDLIVIKY